MWEWLPPDKEERIKVIVKKTGDPGRGRRSDELPQDNSPMEQELQDISQNIAPIQEVTPPRPVEQKRKRFEFSDL